MELEAVYGFLYTLKGKRQQGDPPGVVVRVPPNRSARGRSRDMLFVHLSLGDRDPALASVYHQVVETMAEAYYLASGSVTAALRQAIRAGNEFLMRFNTKVEGTKKQQGGVTCAVLREEEIFIVQAGPSLAFMAHQGELERLPPRQPGHVTPLGVGYGLDTRFYHSWVHPSDVLLLVDSVFENRDQAAVSKAIVYEGVTAGINNLAEMVGADQSSRLMLIEFAPLTPQVATPGPEAPSELEPAAKPASPPPTPAKTDKPTPTVRPPKLPKPTVEIDVEKQARQAASGLAMGAAKMTGGVGRMIEALFGSPPTTGQAVKKNQGPPPGVLGLMALIIPVIVAIIAVAVYTQRGRAAQFQDLLVQMDGEMGLAQAATGDEAAARVHWERILDLADEALKLRPSHETVLDFRSQAQDKIDQYDEVTRLTVRSLYRYQSGGTPDGLTVHSMNVYVLDPGLDFFYKHLVESDVRLVTEVTPETLLFKTQAVGAQVVGELVDLVWFPSSGQIREDTVAVLDTAGLLLRYDPFEGTVQATQLSLPPRWNNPIATAVYADSFYVLDVGAGQIWRFEAQGGEYSEMPTTYRFSPDGGVDVSQMIDMSIDRDGNLYLLGRDGMIYKFFSGERKSFTLTDLKEPLASPTGIFCSLTGLNPFFYIVDPGSGRIIRTTQQGLFIAQYRARGAEISDPFVQITDIYVQEAPELYIYATSGNNLIVATLD